MYSNIMIEVDYRLIKKQKKPNNGEENFKDIFEKVKGAKTKLDIGKQLLRVTINLIV